MALIWLVSYPKSGNTWVRALLSAYLQGSVDVNKMYATPIASARKMLDRNLQTKTADLADEEVELLRPQAYLNLSARYERTGRPGVVKVHDRWKQTSSGAPLFPPAVTRATIYIVRNPLDVTVSLAHHLGISMELAADWVCNEKFQLMSDAAAEKAQVRQMLGSWSTHVNSWNPRPAYNVHLVRYEDLHANPEQEFTRIVEHMGLVLDPARVAAAVKASRMPALQAQELKHRFKEKSAKATAPFFRRGMVGDYSRELVPALVDKVRNYNGETMRKLGYST